MTGTTPRPSAVEGGPATLDGIRRHLVGLKMPRALEVLEHILRRIERGEISALEAIDALLAEDLTLREGRRVKAALKMGRLLNIKTLAGFDFSFQPSLDRDRIMALAQLDFVDRHEVVHFLGQPGCGKTHLALALVASRRSRPAAPSTSPPWPTSSPRRPRPSGKAPCASACASSAGRSC